MTDNESRSQNTSDQKKRIRDRYKGAEEGTIEIIPAIPQEDFFTSVAHKRVAVYARVSTDDPTTSRSWSIPKKRKWPPSHVPRN